MEGHERMLPVRDEHYSHRAPRRPQPRPDEDAIRLIVLTPRSGQVEIDVPAGETVCGLRRRLAEMGEVRGLAGDDVPHCHGGAPGNDEAAARLLFHGMPLKLEVAFPRDAAE